jgi:hypothetical protein
MEEEKKTTSIKLKPSVSRELRMLAAQTDKSVGDIIEALVNFQKSDSFVNDANWVERFHNLWELALINSGVDGRRDKLCKEYYEWLQQLLKIGREQGDEKAMEWLKKHPYEEPAKK